MTLEKADPNIELTDDQVAGIKKAIADVAEGKSVPHDKVSAWVDSFGTEYVLPPSQNASEDEPPPL